MSPQDLFESLVSQDIAPTLKRLGLKKSGMNFGLRGTDVWGVLTVWRDQWNTLEEVRFSITLSLVVDLFRDFDGDRFDPRRVPASMYAHWHRDIGRFLRTERQAFPYSEVDATEWWEIRGWADLEEIRPRVLVALQDVAVPQLRRRRSLAAVVDLWRLEGERLPGGPIHRVLAVRRHGTAAELSDLVRHELAELEGHPHLPVFRAKLDEAGVAVPRS